MKIISIVIFMLVSINCMAENVNTLKFKYENGTSIILNPDNLSVNITDRDGVDTLIISPMSINAKSKSIVRESNSVSWVLDKVGIIEVKKIEMGLSFRITASKNNKLVWPKTGTEKNATDLIIPNGEGLLIPVKDSLWNEVLDDNCYEFHNNLSMPFWAYRYSNNLMATFIVKSEIQAELCTKSDNGKLITETTFSFDKSENQMKYELILDISGKQNIDPSIIYKNFLKDQNKYLSLNDKMKLNKDVEKLMGAPHIYLWGDGRELKTLKLLEQIGVDRAWLGYSQMKGKDQFLVNKAFVNEAIKKGYLIGPYDSFANIQETKKADASNSKWPKELYPWGCIIDGNGRAMEGFGGRGCELSSEALDMMESKKHYIKKRVDKHSRLGINSYFLDVDGMGDFYHDYSKKHPMTKSDDMRNRVKRLNYLSEDRGYVLGSESVVSWGAKEMHFSHGTFYVHNNSLWKFKRNRKLYGSWWPQNAPKIFFKEVIAPEYFINTKYNEQYRIPLFQTVFHESIVTTDRWEAPFLKYKNIFKRKALIELLYGVPSLWHFDYKYLSDNLKTFSDYYKFFNYIHKLIGNKELTAYEAVNDREVQSVTFDNKYILTANFSDKVFKSKYSKGDIASMCIEFYEKELKKAKSYCPKRIK